jgi:NitT/TauT family transport system substrate-binding protein
VRIVIVFAALLLVAACGDSGKPSGQPGAPTKIVFVTDWKAQAEHGGFYEALALGLYKKRGLDVRIMEGGPGVNVAQLLAGGAADFGIGSNSFIPLNLTREGAPFKAVMAVFQKDPQVLITHPRSDLKAISDMKGKPIMIGDAAVATFWPWLKAKYGFEDSQIRKYTFNLAPFLVDPKAIQEGYLSSEPYTIEKEGKFTPQVFLLADQGYPGYANMVLVPQKWIDEKPQVVQAFVEATIEGWMRYLYGDPSPANALIKRDNPEMTDDLIAQAIAKLRGHGIALSGEAQTLGLGAMTDARWKEFYDVMSKEGIYPAGMNYRDAYTLQFVNRGYGLNLVPPDAQQQPPPAP